jgi:hypothetical protein
MARGRPAAVLGEPRLAELDGCQQVRAGSVLVLKDGRHGQCRSTTIMSPTGMSAARRTGAGRWRLPGGWPAGRCHEPAGHT